MQLVKYSSIEQFRNVIREFDQAQFIGLDQDGNPIFDRNLPKPTVTFKGTVKLHGTNAAVGFDGETIWSQSRENIITVEKDNAGFAAFVESKKSAFEELFQKIKAVTGTLKNIMIYGEWCGGNIQKGVAITNLPKSFFIFDIRLFNPLVENSDEYLDITPYSNTTNGIYNIEHYQTWTMDIDFNNPLLSQNKLIEITIGVEDECPVGKAFGFSGVGEGVVWKALHDGNRYVFKVKGEKHSVSKVKTLASVDVEKLGTINEFVEYAVTENRLNQAIENVFGASVINIQLMGEVIRWVVNDIQKEETDTMVKNGLCEKDVNKYISTKVRQLFNDRLNASVGL